MQPIEPPAIVEVDEHRRYINVNESACRLLGYTRDELLSMRIDDLSFPSGAHVDPMFENYLSDGSMQGIFALRRKNGDILWIRFRAKIDGTRMIAQWTEFEVGAAA